MRRAGNKIRHVPSFDLPFLSCQEKYINYIKLLRALFLAYSLLFYSNMRMRKSPELEITKEMDITPFVKRKPTFEQPALELPLPSFPEKQVPQDEDTKEMNLRGVWTIDI